MSLLNVAHVEKGFDGPGWYVTDNGIALWGPYDTEADAEWCRRVHRRDVLGTAQRVNGHVLWIVDTDHADEAGNYPPPQRRGFLVLLDDEDVGPLHQTLESAESYLRGIAAEIRERPEDWQLSPSTPPRPPRKMAPSFAPGQERRKIS